MVAIIILLVLVLIIIIIIPQIKPIIVKTENHSIIVSTEKADYKINENGKVKIENNSDERICFSSCYPYYLEMKKENIFESYSYLSCDIPDLAEKCINPRETKAFEFPFSYSEEGTHRLAISFCRNCNENEQFKAEQWLYSNEFNLTK